MELKPEQAFELIREASQNACAEINAFAANVLRTRGGRIGSGMGTLLEALWGYYVNKLLQEKGGEASTCELGWMPGHQYNDFACVVRDGQWEQLSRTGELLRIEVKSMVASADESKAHFDQLYSQIQPQDLLVVMIWDWVAIDDFRVCPKVIDQFCNLAQPVAYLRDQLHMARGGTFVDSMNCPDDCVPGKCRHAGEPLNESGKRERLGGPESTRVSNKVSYAANFGGMVRMLKTNSLLARTALQRVRKDCDIAHEYISFIHRNLPIEEYNQYTTSDWRKVGKQLGIEEANKQSLVRRIRDEHPGYRTILRQL